MADARMQRLRGLLGPVLVDEPEPHRGQQDHPYDHRVAALTDEERRAGRDRQQHQQRGAELPSQHRKRPSAVRAHRVRPEHPQTPGRLRRRQARPVAAQPGQHIGNSHRARGRNPQRRSRHRTSRIGTVNNCQLGTPAHQIPPHWHPARGHRQGPTTCHALCVVILCTGPARICSVSLCACRLVRDESPVLSGTSRATGQRAG
jgi:hypothetical protein